MASLLRRFAPLIITFVVKKFMDNRNGGAQGGKRGGSGRRR